MATDISIQNKKVILTDNGIVQEVYDIEGNSPIIDPVASSITFTKPKRRTITWSDIATVEGEASVTLSDFVKSIINS